MNSTDFISEAEAIIKEAVGRGDFDKGFKVINELYGHVETYARVVGAGLDMMERRWDEFTHEGNESFLSAVVRKTPLSPVTVRNQINVSKLLSSGKVPEHLLEDVSQLGQKALIRIANTSRSDYDISEDDWLELAEAVSDQQVDALCRNIEGKNPRSNFVGLYYAKNGELLAYVEGEYVSIGQLYKIKEAKVKKGQEVLIARAKMSGKVEY